MPDFDLHDSNLPQYAAALTEGNASGVMCSYFARDTAPGAVVSMCGNADLLNGQIRDVWRRADAVAFMAGRTTACVSC